MEWISTRAYSSRDLRPVVIHIATDPIAPLPACRHRPPNPAAGVREQELGREGRVHVRVELRGGRRRPPRHLHRPLLLRQLLQAARGRRRRRWGRTKRRQQTAGNPGGRQSCHPHSLRYSPCAIVDIDGKCLVHFRATRSTTRRGWEISRTARKPASKLAVSLRQRRRPRRRRRRPPLASLRPLSPSPPQQPLQPPQRLRPPRHPRPLRLQI